MAKKRSPEDVLNELESKNSENFQEVEEPKSKINVTQSVNEGFRPLTVDQNGNLKMDYSGSPEVAMSDMPNNFGWKNIPLNTIPSKGMFYPDDAEITIRSANVAEIRQWSTIDDSDALDINDKMSYIFERCVRFVSHKMPFMTWKDIKELDKFCILFKVHEITFPNNENNLMIEFSCSPSCGFSKSVPLSSQMIYDTVKLDDRIMKYYDYENRRFTVSSPRLDKDILMFVPSIGTQTFIYKTMKKMTEDGKQPDPSLFRIIPFFIQDWRYVKEEDVAKFNTMMSSWSTNKFMFIDGFVDAYTKSFSTNVKYTCERCGEVLERPMFFRGGFGIKDLFSVSTSFDTLI